MIFLNYFIATIVVVIATIHPIRCQTTEKGLKQVCVELGKPSNQQVKFADETGMKDIYANRLQKLTSIGKPGEIAPKIHELIIEWRQELKDIKVCDTGRFSLARLCSSNWKKRRVDLESALTYAYYHLAMNYIQADQVVASLIELNHLRALRMDYKGIPVSQILLLDNITRTSVKRSCNDLELDRILGVKEQSDDEVNIEERYKQLKASIKEPIDFSGLTDDMQLVEKLIDAAYELMKEGSRDEEIQEGTGAISQEVQQQQVTEESNGTDEEIDRYQSRMNTALELLKAESYQESATMSAQVVADVSDSIAKQQHLPERKGHINRLNRLLEQAQLNVVLAIKEQGQFNLALFELKHLKSIQEANGGKPSDQILQIEKNIRNLRGY